MKTPICPTCGSAARTVETSYGLRSSRRGLWSWGGAPLVDRKTHDARKAAHQAFDALWKKHGFTRSRAYKILAERLSLPKEKCHMKLMDAATANRVPQAVASILMDYNEQVIE